MKKYFRRRNKLVTEYSSHSEASKALRERLARICSKYTAKGGYLGIGQGNLWVGASSLEHELFQELNKEDIYSVIYNSGYEDVFTAVEIFTELAKDQAGGRFRRSILPDFVRAFDLSGSVYSVNEDGEISLRIDEKLAKKLVETKEILESQPSASKQFFKAVGNLMGRKKNPQDLVKDLYVALEDFLKVKTGQKSFTQAIGYLKKKKIISPTQISLIEKIHAYRSDVYGTAHAGKGIAPDEADTLWFLETTIAQIKLIDARLKRKNDNSK